MTAEKTAMPFGWRVYGLGVMALGLASLVFREFDPGQPMSDHLPARTVLACVVGAFIVVAAAAIEWRRTVAWGAAALAVYYTVFVVVLMNGRVLLTDYAVYVTYENIAMQLSIAVGALIVFDSTARIDAALAAGLTRVGQLAFGICALIFGGAHFVYMNMTAPMVPKWLPPSQVFWGYVTGVCFVAAGLAILSGVQSRLAAILLTVMLACFGLLANLPILLADHASHFNWTESAVNLAVVGAAWVVADSLARRTPLATTN
ncbi:MAG: hypothetical protein WAL95_19575 [Candidatus Acidiferrales bacterium]